MRSWRIAIGLLLAGIVGLVMLSPSSAQIPPPPTLPPFTFPTFPPIPTLPPPTMPPPTTTPPPTMPPPTTTPPPTMPPGSLPSGVDQLIDDIIDQLDDFGSRFQDVIQDLRDLQSRF